MIVKYINGEAEVVDKLDEIDGVVMAILVEGELTQELLKECLEYTNNVYSIEEWAEACDYSA
jgi:hypothetical protein